MRQQRRRLGEAVALEDQHAHGGEELAHLLGERRATGDEVADAATGALLDLLEDEPIRDAQLKLEPRRIRRAGDVVGVLLAAQSERPAEDLLAQRRAGLDGRGDARVEALIEARHGDHDRRLDLGHVGRKALDHRLGVGDRAASAERHELAGGALGHVRKRQEREEQVVLVEVDGLDAGLEVVKHVAMGQHHALRVGGRAGGMDDGADLVAGEAAPRIGPFADLADVRIGEVEDVVERVPPSPGPCRGRR